MHMWNPQHSTLQLLGSKIRIESRNAYSRATQYGNCMSVDYVFAFIVSFSLFALFPCQSVWPYLFRKMCTHKRNGMEWNYIQN